jgi:hypothetical protein
MSSRSFVNIFSFIPVFFRGALPLSSTLISPKTSSLMIGTRVPPAAIIESPDFSPFAYITCFHIVGSFHNPDSGKKDLGFLSAHKHRDSVNEAKGCGDMYRHGLRRVILVQAQAFPSSNPT